MNVDEPHPKRTKVRLQLQSGHDCIFREELPKHLQIECSICLCVLHDPHMIDCRCGAVFCQPCIQPILKEWSPCPLCNGPFSLSIPNPSVQRTINSLEVYCSFKEAGCEWVGELGMIDEHLNDDVESDTYRSSGCPFLWLNCGYCKEEFPHHDVLRHERNECLKRPYKCDTCNDYESTFEVVTTRHVNVCPCGLVPCPNNCGESLQRKFVDDHLASDCPLEIVSCLFSYAGCEEKLPRKNMLAHISDGLAVHMSLQAISHQKQLEKLQVQIQNLENEVRALRSKEVENLKCVFAHLRIMPITLTLNGYTEKKRNRSHWRSKPFYSHQNGYRMVLSIDCNGYGEGEGTHISVYICMVYGEFDNELKWPFRGAISIELLDQEGTGNNFRQILSFDDAPEEFTCPTTEDDNRGGGWGFSQFISHADLAYYYQKNDSLCFRLSRHA